MFRAIWRFIKGVVLFVVGGLGLLIAAPFAALGGIGYWIYEKFSGSESGENKGYGWWVNAAKRWWSEVWN